MVSSSAVVKVKPRGRFVSNEKLTAVCVFSRVSHRKYAWFIVLKVRVKLIREKVTGVSSAISFWAAALNHEVFYYSVKCQSVIVWITLLIDRFLCIDFIIKFHSFSQANEVRNN